MTNKKREFSPAKTLDEVFDNLSQEPLLKRDEFEAFYRPNVNKVRGEDKIARIRLGLNRSFKGLSFKALLTGHPGVGKSTELTNLVFSIEEKYRVIRFSATSELDPVNFQPFDILLLTMAEVAEQTSKVLEEKHSTESLSSNLLKDIWDWFASEKVTHQEAKIIAGKIEAGAGAKGDSIWAKALGLFAHIRGEIKYSSDRKKETVEHRLVRISSLIDLCNRLLDECNRLLLETINKQWLIIGEDFDKPGIPPEKVEGFFVTNSNINKNLHTHMILTIPVTLAYSQQATLLPVSTNSLFCIPDTPVFDQKHKVHKDGRDAVQSVLEARLDPGLFEEKQMTRLIVASGGNLRDLFSLISHSAENAILRESKTISQDDVTRSINALRIEYKRRLGESPYDEVEITLDDKIERLKQIYNGDPEAAITNAVMHSLLRARAVQEFNGIQWFGVHPLVVDILRDMKHLEKKSGRIPGGTD